MDALRCPPGDTPVKVLSGGEIRRVALCRLLLQKPDILLLDEPTASLDPKTAREIMRLIVELAHDRGTPALVNIHDVSLAQAFSDRILGLRQGEIVFDGQPAELTTAAAREIYGADADFDEAATSTSIDALNRERPKLEAIA